MHGHDHAQVRVHVLELLGDEAEAQVVQPGAALLLRDADAQQVQVGHALQEGALEAVLAVQVVDAWAPPRGRPSRAPLCSTCLVLFRTARNRSWIPRGRYLSFQTGLRLPMIALSPSSMSSVAMSWLR